jgi:hypothetical protein
VPSVRNTIIEPSVLVTGKRRNDRYCCQARRLARTHPPGRSSRSNYITLKYRYVSSSDVILPLRMRYAVQLVRNTFSKLSL